MVVKERIKRTRKKEGERNGEKREWNGAGERGETVLIGSRAMGSHGYIASLLREGG